LTEVLKRKLIARDKQRGQNGSSEGFVYCPSRLQTFATAIKNLRNTGKTAKPI
jgi:hypothetical protein